MCLRVCALARAHKCIKGAHPQVLEVAAIRKIASEGFDTLKTDVLAYISGVDAINCR
jgi:hypothetical protein